MTTRVGGNTPCVQVEAGGRNLAFDAGTGAIPFGAELCQHAEHPGAVYLFLSHLHHDHIEGLRHFQPAYSPGWQCWIYGPSPGRVGLARGLSALMQSPWFPRTMRSLPARIVVRKLPARGHVVLVHPKPLLLPARAGPPADVPVISARHVRAHPQPGVMLYRLSYRGRTVVYATDVDMTRWAQSEFVQFARRADVLILDAQYASPEEPRESPARASEWGHTSLRTAAEIAREADVGELVLFHHDPRRSDAEITDLERLARTIFPPTRAAREGMELQLR